MVIFLVGMMGSGKSTVGWELTQELGWVFEDTDVLISSDMNLSISEIFERYGEEYFRKLENKYLLNMDREYTVVATGGGMPCFENNMNLINYIGISIYLKVDIETLHKRIVSSNDRPLLNLDPTIDSKEMLIKMLKIREPIYNQSNIIIEANQRPEIVVEKIITKVHEYFGN
ncbi:MAG: shikimate kinase [Saprospiraceae bacterium]|nr:shikimate kinase [Saprospiraceae bacterium]